jgi:hypothetical protein
MCHARPLSSPLHWCGLPADICHCRTALAGADGRAVPRTHAKGMLALLLPLILWFVLGSRLVTGADLEVEQPRANATAMVHGAIVAAAVGAVLPQGSSALRMPWEVGGFDQSGSSRSARASTVGYSMALLFGARGYIRVLEVRGHVAAPYPSPNRGIRPACALPIPQASAAVIGAPSIGPPPP